jgi:hypothetical protein
MKHETLIIAVGLLTIAICFVALSVTYVPPTDPQYIKVGTIYRWNGADQNISVGNETFFIHHGENFVVNGSDTVKWS